MLDELKEIFKSLKKVILPNGLSRSNILIRKPRLLIWLIISYIFLWNHHPKIISSNFASLMIYVLLILIALSDFAEGIFRRLEDVRHVATKKEKERLFPLFNEVYERVKEQSHIGDKVRLYIVDQMIVNAFAIGKNTIVVSRGIVSTMSDEEIKGILAHEFAHIIKGDPQVAILVVTATNFYMWGAILVVKLLSFIENTFGANSFLGSLIGLIRSIIELAVNYVLVIITLLVSSSSRRREYKADKLAKELGYGEPLLSALNKLYDMEVSDKKNLIERIKSSHPKLAYRIEALEEMQ